MQSSDDGDQWHGPATHLTTVDLVTKKGRFIFCRWGPLLLPIAVNMRAIPSDPGVHSRKGQYLDHHYGRTYDACYH